MARLEGSQLGNYELLEHIGTGGMAEVYRARQLNAFGREVAVKVIKHDFAEQPLFYERFMREAQATARLSHPHILPLIELGTVGRKRQLFFLVMPYVPDGTLRDLLAQTGGPLPIEMITPLFIQLCDAVQYAHEQGLIHRDIKPSNILLQHERHVLLADFGIALNIEDMRLTSTGMGLGTPEYTSPEQAQGMVDKRSDIYSLGIVLFELLTGQVPFKGRTPYEVFYKQTSAPVPSLREVYPNLPEPLTRLDPVIQKALAKEPEQRFQTASALGDAFQTALSGVAVAPDDLPAEIIAHEPARISGNGTGNETRANRGLVTPMDDDPLGERTTNPYSQPARFRGFPNRYAQVAQPAPRGGGGALIVTAMLALLLLAVATFAVIGFLLIENGGHSANTTPITIPTASPQLTPTLTPTNTPQRSPSPTPSPTATPTPSPSPTPSPTPTPPPPTPTP